MTWEETDLVFPHGVQQRVGEDGLSVVIPIQWQAQKQLATHLHQHDKHQPTPTHERARKDQPLRQLVRPLGGGSGGCVCVTWLCVAREAMLALTQSMGAIGIPVCVRP